MPVASSHAADLGTAFTYQGYLEKPAGSPVANDTCTFQFKLCDSAMAACAPATISNHPGISVTGGVFTVPDVDFGAGAMSGDARWLEITVDCGNPGDPVTLTPRVELTPAPHAIRASKGVGPPNTLEVDALGRLGIGTSTPLRQLDMVGLPDLQTVFRMTSDSQLGSFLEMYNKRANPVFLGHLSFLDSGGFYRGAIEFLAQDEAMTFSTSPPPPDPPLERMRIDSSGRVGIGTTTPAAPLHVKTTTDNFAVYGESSGFAGVVGVNNASDGAVGVYGYSGANTGINYGVYGVSYSPTGYGVLSSGRMRATGNLICDGFVGIGTSAPTALLTIDGSGDSFDGIDVISPGGATGSVSINSPAGVPGINGYANNGDRRDIRFTDTGLSLLRSSTASAPSATQGISISGLGWVGIGDAIADAALDVVGDINYTGTITDVSDRRLKENIAALHNALAKVRQLDGVYFNMKETPEEREVGLIAQNVREVLPEAVRVVDPEAGYLGVSYPSLIPLLVEAIKEMETEFDARIACREQEIDDLRSRVEALERAGAGSIVRAGLPLVLVAVVGLVALRRRSTRGGSR